MEVSMTRWRSGRWLAVLYLVAVVAAPVVGQPTDDGTSATVKVLVAGDRPYESFTPLLQEGPLHELAVHESWSRRTIFRIPRRSYEALDPSDRPHQISDLIRLPAGDFDTYAGMPEIPPALRADPTDDGLWLVQPFDWFYNDPDRNAFSDASKHVLTSSDEPYVDPGLRVFWPTPEEREDFTSRQFREDLFARPRASAPPRALQWAEPFHPFFKLDAELDLNDASSESLSVVSVWGRDTPTTIAWLEEHSASPPQTHQRGALLAHQVVLAGIDLATLARRPDVISIRRHDAGRTCHWPRLREVLRVRRLASVIDVDDPAVEVLYGGENEIWHRVLADRLREIPPRDLARVGFLDESVRLPLTRLCSPPLAHPASATPRPLSDISRDGLDFAVVSTLTPNGREEWFNTVVQEGARAQRIAYGQWRVRTTPSDLERRLACSAKPMRAIHRDSSAMPGRSPRRSRSIRFCWQGTSATARYASPALAVLWRVRSPRRFSRTWPAGPSTPHPPEATGT